MIYKVPYIQTAKKGNSCRGSGATLQTSELWPAARCSGATPSTRRKFACAPALQVRKLSAIASKSFEVRITSIEQTTKEFSSIHGSSSQTNTFGKEPSSEGAVLHIAGCGSARPRICAFGFRNLQDVGANASRTPIPKPNCGKALPQARQLWLAEIRQVLGVPGSWHNLACRWTQTDIQCYNRRGCCSLEQDLRHISETFSLTTRLRVLCAGGSRCQDLGPEGLG